MTTLLYKQRATKQIFMRFSNQSKQGEGAFLNDFTLIPNKLPSLNPNASPHANPARWDKVRGSEKRLDEKRPILGRKGRRSRAELRPEGCAGAFRAERPFVGSEVAFRCDEDGEEGTLSRANAPRNAKSKC